jgi:hypothetical protein
MADQEQPGDDAAGKRDFVNVAPLQLEQHLTPQGATRAGNALAFSGLRQPNYTPIKSRHIISQALQQFFGNFVPKKPENKREGISPNYNNPHKGYGLPGTKRFLSGSLGFLFFFYFLPDGLLA